MYEKTGPKLVKSSVENTVFISWTWRYHRFVRITIVLPFQRKNGASYNQEILWIVIPKCCIFFSLIHYYINEENTGFKMHVYVRFYNLSQL
jgi:hypothetical protein